jgi:GNAT superfamily N-acetyltransferase
VGEIEYGDVKCPSGGQGAKPTNKSSTLSMQCQHDRVQLHISKVRDYRDRFILRQLQAEARVENPGFLYLIEGKEKAKMVWAGDKEGREPAGYYIYGLPRREFSKHAHEVVHFPAVFSQVYVRPEFRRRGVATRMLQDFIQCSGGDTIWVESPKGETVALLHKMGYYEPNLRYELWQMMEGLSRWMKVDDLVIRAQLVPESSEEFRVWQWDTSVDLKDLR